MCIETVKSGSRACRCGCGQIFPTFSGLLRYGLDNLLAFHAAHLSHEDGGPHLWLLLGSGPWFSDHPRACWLTLHTWIEEDKVIAKVEEPDNSPFSESDCYGERCLTRNEVLSKQGGLEWAIERRDDFVRHHQPSKAFLRGVIGA